jgi:hypothetical protein
LRQRFQQCTPLSRNAFHRQGLTGIYVYTTATIFLLGASYISNIQSQYPSTAVTYIESHPCSRNIFNHYNYGAYLIWKLPQYKVYIDGQMPSWKTDTTNYFEEYQKVRTDKKFRAKEFSKYSVTCVLFPASEKQFIDQLKSEGWQVKVEAEKAVLLIAPQVL